MDLAALAGDGVRRVVLALALLGAVRVPLALAGDAEAPTVIVVVGAAGSPEYGAAFAAASDRWKRAATKGGADCVIIGRDGGGTSDRQLLQEAVTREGQRGRAPLWLVLVGHGTFDGRTARFNLRGPDFTPKDLSSWLAPVRRPLVVINTASASAPFVKELAGRDRVIIVATKTGAEQNATRLSMVLGDAIDDPRADLDKDGQTSLLEAYLVAAKRVDESFTDKGRLATEHALLDDNGDGLGTPASWYRALQPIHKADNNAPIDGFRAHQIHLVPSDPERKMPAEMRRRRDELEREVHKLRDTRATLTDDAYFAKVEPLLVEIARIYERAAPSTP